MSLTKGWLAKVNSTSLSDGFSAVLVDNACLLNKLNLELIGSRDRRNWGRIRP